MTEPCARVSRWVVAIAGVIFQIARRAVYGRSVLGYARELNAERIQRLGNIFHPELVGFRRLGSGNSPSAISAAVRNLTSC
jgi:hypothetical protein